MEKEPFEVDEATYAKLSADERSEHAVWLLLQRTCEHLNAISGKGVQVAENEARDQIELLISLGVRDHRIGEKRMREYVAGKSPG